MPSPQLLHAPPPLPCTTCRPPVCCALSSLQTAQRTKLAARQAARQAAEAAEAAVVATRQADPLWCQPREACGVCPACRQASVWLCAFSAAAAVVAAAVTVIACCCCCCCWQWCCCCRPAVAAAVAAAFTPVPAPFNPGYIETLAAPFTLLPPCPTACPPSLLCSPGAATWGGACAWLLLLLWATTRGRWWAG